MYRLLRVLARGLLVAAAVVAQAQAASGYFEVQKVTNNVFALVGPLGDRAPENLGNNATYGVVITPEGVVLIDSGGTWQGARRIHETIRSITDIPVRIVVNTNSQDHRWLGNDYFRRQGARIIAQHKMVEDQQ
ncbi:MAG: MBL fold metallo-hydrolase, partial [Gammaproteobacteria bacterium]